MQFVRMMAAPELQAAGFGVRRLVGNGVLHPIALVQFVEQHKAPFFLRDIVVNPDFPRRHELIHVVVSSRGEIDIEDTAYESPVYNPHGDAILQFLPEAFMCPMTIWELLAPMRCLGNVAGPSPFLALDTVGFEEGLPIPLPLGHQLVLNEKMVYIKRLFVMIGFFVDPEFVRGNVFVSEMLPKVRELLVDVSTDITTIHDPHLDVTAFINLMQVRKFQRICHGAFRVSCHPSIS